MDLLLSIHDRSDGGLITTLVEMCLAGNCGAHISIDDKSILASLFNEELGFVLEYAPENEEAIRAIIDADGLLNAFKQLGETRSAHVLTVGWHLAEMDAMLVLNATLKQLRQCWEATSDQLELLQADPTTVNAERASYGEDAYLGYNVSFQPQPTDPNLLESKSRHRVAILREEGTNGDREMAAAFFAAGLDPWDLTMSDLLDGFISPDNFRGVVFPGGFSYMDVLGSAKGWAGSIRFSDRVRSWFARFFERSDTFSLGVCNGCQLMALLGWIPYKGLKEKFQPRFVQNTSKRFESRWTHVQITESPSILLRDMEGSRLGVWVAHGEGRLMFPDLSILDSVQSKSLAPMAFVDPDGKPTETYPFNPNGSVGGLTSLCSPDGRHLAMMPHPERCFQKWQWPWMPKDQSDVLAASPWLRMFQNAREWCDSTR
jgi:phosphoribosylformylglycinamidine synthase